MHAELLSFSKGYEKRHIQSWHRLVAYVLVETEKGEGIRQVDTGGPRKIVCGYPMFQVLDADRSIPVTSITMAREREMYTLHQCMGMVPADLESIYTVRFCAES